MNYSSPFGLTSSFQSYSRVGWERLLVNLTIYGKQPIDAIKQEESERAIRLDKALHDKYEEIKKARKR